MKGEAVRLKNAPKGQPYAIERAGDLSPGDAAEQAATWWESRGTLAVVVLIAGKEDSRYERDYMEADRVPDDWVSAKAPPRKSSLPKIEIALPEPPKAPPTITNRAQKGKRPKTCSTCGRRGGSGLAPTTDAQHCPTCGLTYRCRVCNADLPKDRKYAGDDDPTPSGRINNRRCPGCGAPMRRSRRQIYQLYTRQRRK